MRSVSSFFVLVLYFALFLLISSSLSKNHHYLILSASAICVLFAMAVQFNALHKTNMNSLGSRIHFCNGFLTASIRSLKTVSSNGAEEKLGCELQELENKKKGNRASTRPFKLLTEERGHKKKQQFSEKVQKMFEEEQKMRITMAQGLPYTTDEPQILPKPPAKAKTRPLNIKLHTERRASERQKLENLMKGKLNVTEKRKLSGVAKNLNRDPEALHNPELLKKSSTLCIKAFPSRDSQVSQVTKSSLLCQNRVHYASNDLNEVVGMPFQSTYNQMFAKTVRACLSDDLENHSDKKEQNDLKEQPSTETAEARCNDKKSIFQIENHLSQDSDSGKQESLKDVPSCIETLHLIQKEHEHTVKPQAQCQSSRNCTSNVFTLETDNNDRNKDQDACLSVRILTDISNILDKASEGYAEKTGSLHHDRLSDFNIESSKSLGEQRSSRNQEESSYVDKYDFNMRDEKNIQMLFVDRNATNKSRSRNQKGIKKPAIRIRLSDDAAKCVPQYKNMPASSQIDSHSKYSTKIQNKSQACKGAAGPFKLLTEERGQKKKKQFSQKVKKMLEQKQDLRIPIAQLLPYTTHVPQFPPKPAVKAETIPLDIKLHTERRVAERSEFQNLLKEKQSLMEKRKIKNQHLEKVAGEEEIRRLRKQMIPRARPMPNFDNPFKPNRSSKLLAKEARPSSICR